MIGAPSSTWFSTPSHWGWLIVLYFFIGGFGAFFLLLDEPEVYGLPPDPVDTTRDLPEMWRSAGLAAATLVAGALLAFAGGRR